MSTVLWGCAQRFLKVLSSKQLQATRSMRAKQAVTVPMQSYFGGSTHGSYMRAVPEVQGDEIWKFGSEKCGLLVANVLSILPRKNRHQFCHRKLHHILHFKKGNLSPRCHSGRILVFHWEFKNSECAPLEAFSSLWSHVKISERSLFWGEP